MTPRRIGELQKFNGEPEIIGVLCPTLNAESW